VAAFVSVLRVPKAGSSEHEYEDAAAVLPVGEYTELLDRPVAVAVADGASESLLSRDWAHLLVENLTEHGAQDNRTLRDRAGFAAALAEASRRWAVWIADYPDRRAAAGRPVQWYELPKLERGAYATVLAARFEQVADISQSIWHAAALGDSCMFQVRGSDLLLAFPVGSAADFDNTPALVNSRGHETAIVMPQIKIETGVAESGDQFFLCTDAIAAWFLAQAEYGATPWEELYGFTRFGDNEGFLAWLTELRSDGRIRNDDVTVVHVDLG
jgi:hypothetical protein